MRRTFAIAILGTSGLLMAGCGSSTTATPAASSAAPAASTSTSATTSATTSSSSSAASGSVSPELATWASSFCTAAAPYATYVKLPPPDYSSPASTKTTLAAFYRQFADIMAKTATALGPVGPPPGGDSPQFTSGAVDGLTSTDTMAKAQAAEVDAVNPADEAALAPLVANFAQIIKQMPSSSSTLGKAPSPAVVQALSAAPECKALNG